jgi:hypothetical protein
MANAMFNDRIEKLVNTEKPLDPYELGKQNLAFPRDAYSYSNPEDDIQNNKTLRPQNWTASQWRKFWGLHSTSLSTAWGVESEDFMVWMRTSALSTFRKLWYRIKSKEGSGSGDGLRPGVYNITIKNDWQSSCASHSAAHRWTAVSLKNWLLVYVAQANWQEAVDEQRLLVSQKFSPS